MSDFNKIFDSFPDYDVFDPNNREIKNSRQEKVYGDNDYIEYDEKRDFRNKKTEPQPPINQREIPYKDNEAEHSTDYRDDFGVYKVYEEKIRNYGTMFFFPATVVWLECILRLGCGQSLMNYNMFFVVLFSLSFSVVPTILSTLFTERFNRALAKIITATLTIWYCIQIVHFALNGTFLLFSDYTPPEQTLSNLNAVMDTMSDKVYYLLLCFVPFVFNLFFGKYIFPFRPIRVPAKICLLLVGVLLHFSAITVISFDKNTLTPYSNYSVYHQQAHSNLVQEKFGLYTMQIKDLFQ